MEVDVPENANGVLYALAGFFGGIIRPGGFKTSLALRGFSGAEAAI